jgi:hypothetical protein
MADPSVALDPSWMNDSWVGNTIALGILVATIAGVIFAVRRSKHESVWLWDERWIAMRDVREKAARALLMAAQGKSLTSAEADQVKIILEFLEIISRRICDGTIRMKDVRNGMLGYPLVAYHDVAASAAKLTVSEELTRVRDRICKLNAKSRTSRPFANRDDSICMLTEARIEVESLLPYPNPNPLTGGVGGADSEC